MTKINLLNAFPATDPTCRRIPLTQGQATLVGAEDYDSLNQDKWQAAWNPNTQTFYAQRTVYSGGKRTLILHRELMGLEPGDPRDVHHLNGDTLDNRRSNLKVVTRLQHADEHRNDPMKNASQYGIGVYLEPRTGRFEARARIDRKLHSLGTFDTAEEAQQARDTFLQQHGERPLVWNAAEKGCQA